MCAVDAARPPGQPSLPTYTTMEVNRIFSAEQIVVKPELPGILKDYSKALIRENPDDIYAFSAEYFRQKAGVGGEPLYQMTKDAMGNAPKEGV